MSSTNQISKVNFQNEIKFNEFMDNSYEQITKDITKILFEMQKEKKNHLRDNDNFNQKFFDNETNVNNRINNNIISNNNYPINIINNTLPLYNSPIIPNSISNSPFLYQAINEGNLSGSYDADTPNNIININNIIKNEDKRTTLIIKNIPNNYTMSLLLIEFKANFKNKFDVIYLPQDKVNDCNLGYGFINFIHPLHLILFYKEFMGKKWNYFNSQKRCFLAYSNYQGKKDLINYTLKKLGIKNFKKRKLDENIRKSFYIKNIRNIKAPLEIPIKNRIQYDNYLPFSLCNKKGDKSSIIESFKK